MINFIFFVIFFLNFIPSDVTGLEPFSCNQPFGTMADKGFSVVRKNGNVELNVYWSDRSLPVLLDLKTRSVDPGDAKDWKPRILADDWTRFKSIINSDKPGAIRVLLEDEKFLQIDDSVVEDITEQLNKLLPFTTNVTSWSSFGDYQLIVYTNDIAYWTHTDSSSNQRIDSVTDVFHGSECKVSILDIEGEGVQAILTTIVTYGNLVTLKKIKFGDPIMAWRDTQWMTTREFLGCPRSICFDGHIDAAITNFQDSLLLYIGQYELLVTLSNGLVHRPTKHEYFNHDPNGSKTNSITAATEFAAENGRKHNLLITSTGDVLVSIDERLFDVKSVSDINLPGTIDAAFSVKNQLTFIVGHQSITKSIRSIRIENDGKASIKFGNITTTNYNYLQWLGVFADIDAAYQLNGLIFFISRNFIVSANIDGGPTSETQLIQGNLFNCPDNEYNKPILGINKFSDFVEYQEKLKPPIATMVTTTEKGTTTTNMIPSGPTLPTPTSSKATIAIIVLVVILLVFVVLIATIYYRKTYATTSFNNHDTSSLITIDSIPVQ